MNDPNRPDFEAHPDEADAARGGLIDPRTIHPAPDAVQPPDPPTSIPDEPAEVEPASGSSAESETEIGAGGLVDPRSEIPGPPGI